ncbi:hypothetical protein F5X68DRAFT_250052 [Plectosphaerella plurivora]|uniref:Fungal STAND N-terminal Goodbye domain-containing protein n=1 Tax=Plectosphaerella plurivora TaxID=936078 RepID=A0A9P9A3V6_9PEZI|nr:hypothetical protein F5X68DRAFT_250052 [Plectosphaerella plurivora]
MGEVDQGRAALEEKLKNDNRDVSDLWKDALKAYKGIVGFDLQRKFDSVDSLIAFSTEQMNGFHTFRHDNKKVDKLRSLFADNMDLIETGALQLVSAATPAFPPAAAIGTALTYLLQACRQQRADYDTVMVFFEDMQGFLTRITILETRLPKYKAYQNCLMEVFTSFLTMCGFAHKYIELGRFKKWISNLLKGEDGELGGARAELNKKLGHLQQATELAILGNTEETLKMTSQLEENQRSHTMLLERVGERLDNIHENTENIRDDVSKLLRLFGASNKPPQQPEKPVAKKPPSANGVRHALPIVSNDDHEYRVLKETLIPDTCSWVFAEPEWETWLNTPNGARPVLAVTAQPGAGKSHIAASIRDRLAQVAREDEAQRSCVAHFYFREQELAYSIFVSGIVTAVNQIAETNGAICERFSAQIARDDVEMDVYKWQDIVKHLLSTVFGPDSKNHLFLVLDGLDEMRDFKSFEEFLSEWIVKEKLRISLAVTSRPSRLESLPADMPIVRIEATKEKQKDDLKTLIWHQINSHNNLRRFSRYVKQRIADTIQEASPNMLYAEHLLQRLDNVGREGAVLKALAQKKPENLHGIYEILLDECQRRMPETHQVVAASLLHWIAFSNMPTSMNSMASLIKEFSSDDTFDIEEIPEFFSKFLRIGDPGYDAELRAQIEMSQRTAVYDLKQEPENEDDAYSDGPLPVKFMERSMRHYFTDSSPNISAFRWGTSEANRRMFLTCTRLCQPVRTDVDKQLQHYCALHLINHWLAIKIEQHDVRQQVEVLEAFAEALSNKTNLSGMLQRAGMSYGRGSTSITNERVKEWFQLLGKPEVRSELSEFALAWWDSVGPDPSTCRRGLAEGYLRDLYQSLDVEGAARAWHLLQGVLVATGLGKLLMRQASINFPEAFEGVEMNEDGEIPFDEAQASLGIIGLFDNVKPDAGGYRAAAEVLLEFEYVKEAEKTCREGLERCNPGDLEFFRTSSTLSKILLDKRRTREEALAVATKAAEELANHDVPSPLKRTVFTTKARAEAKLNHEDAALKSFADAKAADPEGATPGADLVDELEVLDKRTDRSEYIRVLKSWGLLERITWLAWNFEDDGEDRHALFCDIAVEQHEEAFMVSFYQEVVDFLDNLGAGLPLRLHLALVYFEVCNDPARALEELDKVFDSHAPALQFPILGVSSSYALEKAVDIMVNVHVELFRATRDPAAKASHIAALTGLLDRHFCLDVPRTSSFWTGQQRVGLAYMHMVVGPLEKFQTTLQSLLDDCFAGLNDSVGWNDGPFLWMLAQCLALLSKALRDDEGLRRRARIVASALFSKLTPGKADAAEDGSEDSTDKTQAAETKDATTDEDDDEDDAGSVVSLAPDDQGDLLGERWWSCGGFCSPAKTFTWWKDRSVYFYITHATGMICEECQAEYELIQRGEVVRKRRHFQGITHDRLKLPVEGWKGVTDGVLYVEGDEPIKVDDLFKNVQEECARGFERLWAGL